MKLPDGTNIFTCSFCCSTYIGPPCVLGRSSRLACHSCSTAIFNLSICWVCGEVIFQGEGGVSLGWCFWHGDCYGCLLCGSRVIYRGVKARELFGGRGIEEVVEVPLCWDCVIEMEVGEGRSENATIWNGLGTGLLRNQWDKQNARGMRSGHPISKEDVRLPDCSRNYKNRKGYNTTRKFLGSSSFNIRANVSDPIDGEPIRVYPIKQKPKLRRSQRGWSSRCLPLYRFSEPG
ncbi:hypothetical protein GGI43DRAFT_166237 [Trichoderma evansii]